MSKLSVRTPARKSTLALAVAFGLSAAFAAACVPHRDVPAADIPKLTSLKDLMDVQATVADPQFKKIGEEAKYTDADYAAFEDVATRIDATSTKAKSFSKGPEFDKFADELNAKAKALGDAAKAKNGKASSDALASMKATCKACHSAVR